VGWFQEPSRVTLMNNLRKVVRGSGSGGQEVRTYVILDCMYTVSCLVKPCRRYEPNGDDLVCRHGQTQEEFLGSAVGCRQFQHSQGSSSVRADVRLSFSLLSVLRYCMPSSPSCESSSLILFISQGIHMSQRKAPPKTLR